VVEEIKRSQEMKEPLNIQRSMFSMKNKETLTRLMKENENEENKEKAKKIEERTVGNGKVQLKGKNTMKRRESKMGFVNKEMTEKERIIMNRERKVLFSRKNQKRGIKKMKLKASRIRAEIRQGKKKE
jgi:maltodextrin utilization protein YvdJ